MSPAQKKQVKHACKLLACFGKTKLGWKDEGEQLIKLNTILRVCQNPTIEKLLQNLWSADDSHQSNLKYWSKRTPKALSSYQPQVPALNFDQRDSWINQGRNLDLQWCLCPSHTKEVRALYEKELVSKLVMQFPPHSHPQLTIMSLGSGYLLQDWVLLNEIAQQNYKKINLHLVDPGTGPEYIEQLTKLAKILAASKNIEIKIEFADSLKSLPLDNKFDCIHAIDFKLSEIGCWETLADGLPLLSKAGFVFTTGSAGRFVFSNETRQWDIRGEQQFAATDSIINLGETVKFAVDYMDQFWNHDLGVIAELVAKNVKRIEIDLLRLSAIDIPYLNQVLRKLFPIDIVVRFKTPIGRNVYQLATIPKDKINRVNCAQLLGALKPGGALLLSGSPYQRNSKI
jgi:hypothetical protein